jgi:glycosyltransferase involved in cell wall biosynthesis
MVIGIDASRAFTNCPTGIDLYSYFLIFSLKETFLSEYRVLLYVRDGAKIPFTLPKQWEICTIKWPFLWTQGGLSLEMLRRKPDVLFVPSYVFPIILAKENVLVVHGLEYEEYPKGYSWCNRLYMRFFLRRSLQKASSLISVSHNTKRLLQKYYDVSQEISVVYEGLPMERMTDSQTLKKKPFFLVVGRLELRKNIFGIIEAFEIFRGKQSRSYKLFFVGSRGYGWKKIQKRIRESPYKEDIICKGYVSDEKKRRLFLEAQALVFLSFAEGFGLPILEAQYFKTPLIVSDISVFREVAGQGAYFVNPRQALSLADVFMEVVRPSLHKDAILQYGRENIERFSWEKSAQEIALLLTRRKK